MGRNETEVFEGDEQQSNRTFLDSLITLLQIIAIALVINLAIKGFLVRPYTVISGSMEPTLMTNDKVFAEVVTGYFSKPQSKDIIVFVFPEVDPNNPKIRQTTPQYIQSVISSLVRFQWPDNGEVEYVKRIIGTPGDVIDIKDGKVFVNNQQLDESAYLPQDTTTDSYGILNYPYTVPQGKYFVLGDNREHSFDSRYWGPVPQENIIGKPFMIYFPFNNFRIL